MNFSFETKEKIPFSLFLLKKPNLNNNSLILKEKRDKEIESKLRSVSPFINGRKNPVFLHPNFISQVQIGKRDSNPVMIKKYDISKSEIEQKDPRAFHVELNNKTKEAITSKIRSREKLSEVVAKKLVVRYDDDKEKLIKKNEVNENFFNKPSYNPLLEKTRQRNKSMEAFIQKSEKYTKNADFEKDKYYKIYVNNYQSANNKEKDIICSKIASRENYIKTIKQQIIDKKESDLMNKFNEDRIITEVNNIMCNQYEKEDNLRKKRNQQIKNEFAEGNRFLIQLRRERSDFQRKIKLDDEIMNISKIHVEEEKIKLLEKEKREKEKKDLSDALSKYIENKRLKEDLEKHNMRKFLSKSHVV